MTGLPPAEQSALCLNLPSGANGKKQKSSTSVAAEASCQADAEHPVIHNLDMADELSFDDELLKRPRLGENSVGSGLCL